MLCVRYRYDAVQRKRFKTVELIIEESRWLPPMRPEQMVAIRIDNQDQALKRRILAVRGIWNGNVKVWTLPYRQVLELGLLELGLEDKIEIKNVSNNGKVDVSIIGNVVNHIIHVGFIAEWNFSVAKFVISAKNQQVVGADPL